MRRRRQNRGTWMPINPTYLSDTEIGVTWYEGTLTVTAGSQVGDTTIAAVPVLLDSTEQTGSNTATLRDLVEGQDYLLERVVGKVWARGANGEDQVLEESLHCIALAILPVGDENPDVPGIPAEDYNPLFANNCMAPWLWRRTWKLGNPYTPTGSNYPTSTAYYGSIADGGHLDTKGVKRRITKEQRLFVIAAVGALAVTEGPGVTNAFTEWGYDLRCVGQMRKARNRSTFK